mmetsp:Transcript_28798/g.32266  ORF Transcript_28798/g.32266 Transcript_28798/m.32266 type:complete len:220 (-) Transcript_28798:633-1292(-)
MSKSPIPPSYSSSSSSPMLSSSSDFFFSMCSSYIFFSPSFFLKKRLLSIFLGLLKTISDNNIIENRSSLDLPDFKSNVRTSILAYLVHIFVLRIFWIVDHRVLPFSLVVYVVDHFCFPVTLKFGIVDHRWFPFAVVLIIPVFRFSSIRIGNILRLFVPILWLFILRICHFSIVDPVFGFFSVGILNGFGSQEVEVLVEWTFSYRLIIDENLKCIVGLND